jgi:hypothetical protein
MWRVITALLKLPPHEAQVPSEATLGIEYSFPATERSLYFLEEQHFSHFTIPRKQAFASHSPYNCLP